MPLRSNYINNMIKSSSAVAASKREKLVNPPPPPPPQHQNTVEESVKLESKATVISGKEREESVSIAVEVVITIDGGVWGKWCAGNSTHTYTYIYERTHERPAVLLMLPNTTTTHYPTNHYHESYNIFIKKYTMILLRKPCTLIPKRYSSITECEW